MPICWKENFYFIYSREWMYGTRTDLDPMLKLTLALLTLPVEESGGLRFNCAEKYCQAYLIYNGESREKPRFEYGKYLLHKCSFSGT